MTFSKGNNFFYQRKQFLLPKETISSTKRNKYRFKGKILTQYNSPKETNTVSKGINTGSKGINTGSKGINTGSKGINTGSKG